MPQSRFCLPHFGRALRWRARSQGRSRRGGRGFSRYTLERKLLAVARRNVRRHATLGRLVRRVREACDVLLR